MVLTLFHGYPCTAFSRIMVGWVTTIFTLRCQSHNRRSRVIAVFSGSIITHRVIRHGRLARRMAPRWTVSSTLTQASSPCCIRMKWAGWSYKGRRVPCTDASLNSFFRPDTGEWVPVPPQPNTFIINTGRAMGMGLWAECTLKIAWLCQAHSTDRTNHKFRSKSN